MLAAKAVERNRTAWSGGRVAPGEGTQGWWKAFVRDD
jgi:hypothetical protein